jgi:chromosome segregation ATPase
LEAAERLALVSAERDLAVRDAAEAALAHTQAEADLQWQLAEEIEKAQSAAQTSALKVQTRNFQQQRNEMQRQVDTLTEAVETATYSQDTLCSEKKSLQGELAAAVVKFENLERQRSVEVGTVGNRYRSLEQQFSAASTRIETLTTSQGNLRRERDDLAGQVDELTAQVDELTVKVHELTAHVEQARRGRQNLDGKDAASSLNHATMRMEEAAQGPEQAAATRDKTTRAT